MTNPDLLIYPVHAAFWWAFGVAGWFATRQPAPASPPEATPAAPLEATAAYSRSVLALHFVAFGVLYFGLGNAVLPDRVPHLFPGQRASGTLLIAIGAGVMCWARIWFHSWRFRAKLDTGHQLATGGPFHFIRHPIYLGLNLLALGSAIWVPTATTWVGSAFMILGSDLRGRAEEKLLSGMFGGTYAAYCRRTARFVPGLY